MTLCRLNLLTFLSVAVMAAYSTCTLAQDMTNVKCIMDSKAAASADASVEYRGGKVYFCCEGCAKDFESKMSDSNYELLPLANHQLVTTGQFKQSACPLTGKPAAADKTVEVGGAKVGVCCGGCESKVKGAADDATKVKMIFANAAFEKGFAQAKAEPKLDGVKCFLMPKKDVKKDVTVAYGDHTVYLCCKSCKKKFEKDPATYTTQANQQLVQTEQVKQKKCPISGGAVKDDQSTKVNGIEVKFCCDKCKGKVESAKDEEKAEMVFGKDAFEKGFK